jgi:hypothetical protein
MNKQTNKRVLTRDNFVKVLNLKKVTAHVKNREQRDILYGAILEVLASENAISKAPQSVGAKDLALQIPGTGVHIRLTETLRQCVADVVTAFLLLPPDRRAASAGIAVLNRIRANVSVARKASGERCILDVIGEVDQSTAGSICLQLLGLPCRYLTAGCQHMKGTGVCGFQLATVNDVLKVLEAKKVLQKNNINEPHSWVVTI